MSAKIRFNNTANTRFFATLRQRVDAYFGENEIDRTANPAMWFKAVLMIVVYLGLYGTILLGQFSGLVTLGLALLMGVAAALIGFNVCHDAIHGSLGQRARTNQFYSSIFYLIGANPYVWHLSHNIVHHTYTNIPGHDEDIEVFPGLVRLDAAEGVNRVQRYQHIYAFILYSLASLAWVITKDFKKFYQSKIGQHTTVHPAKEYFNLYFYKTLYYLFFIVLPVIVLPFAWWQVLLGFVAMHLAEGLVLGLVFQLAHVVEGTDFPVPNAANQLDEAWAAHQLRTTANFSPQSKLAAFLLGGLNRQIEHHLFPKVCHVHYPALAPIVRQTAEEFNLPYLENRSFWSALGSHYRLLRLMGKEAYRQKQQIKPESLHQRAA
jgi:linoleoyl-CoA desaturase